MKELPGAGVTLATGEGGVILAAGGGVGFDTGTDGFFSSGGDTLKYKMPRSRPRQQHGQSRQTVAMNQFRVRLMT